MCVRRGESVGGVHVLRNHVWELTEGRVTVFLHLSLTRSLLLSLTRGRGTGLTKSEGFPLQHGRPPPQTPFWLSGRGRRDPPPTESEGGIPSNDETPPDH